MNTLCRFLLFRRALTGAELLVYKDPSRSAGFALEEEAGVLLLSFAFIFNTAIVTPAPTTPKTNKPSITNNHLFHLLDFSGGSSIAGKLLAVDFSAICGSVLNMDLEFSPAPPAAIAAAV